MGVKTMQKLGFASIEPVRNSRPPRPAQKTSAFGVTIQDVAVISGYSTATVSRVISGRGYVRGTTAELIRAAADRLGYQPDQAAQALAERSAQARRRRAHTRQRLSA